MVARIAARLKEIVRPSNRLLTGLSGGVDSVVLLDLLQRVSRTLRFRLSALHINHQLSRNAARWSAFCRDLCRRRGISFESVRVEVRRGDSLEAAARDARYAVFARQQCDFVVLAHHRDDQVETLLLQLLRGAGAKGLAGMPPVRKAEGGKPSILRPLLDVTREEILDYARRRKLEWIEDESNQDVYFHRNFIRHEVLPLIARRFPAYRATLARAAGHLAEAAQVLDELAAADAAGHLEGGTLSVAAFRSLPPARARNLLRYLLASHGVPMPNAERLDEALRQALSAKRDAQVRIELGGFDLRRFENRLHVVAAMKDLPAGYGRRWRGQSEIALPELGGVLAMPRVRGAGISLARLRGRPVTIGVRRGGERLQPDCRRPRRSLKNLLQETRVPPWQRGRVPLLLCGGELVWVAGIGVDCRYQAAGAEPGVRPAWSAMS
ncbi:MAG TPA: tRNA lysidine(34) synthetase TilS [Burkholderiales bacterium]|nr:tRNA lysidine(34) synthetase TilS [Burkholderiales bacterium]